jgi:hypothetical protein
MLIWYALDIWVIIIIAIIDASGKPVKIIFQREKIISYIILFMSNEGLVGNRKVIIIIISRHT